MHPGGPTQVPVTMHRDWGQSQPTVAPTRMSLGSRTSWQWPMTDGTKKATSGPKSGGRRKPSAFAHTPESGQDLNELFPTGGHLHLECRSHRAEERMSHSRMVPLLLLYTNTLHWCGWNSAAVITSVSSSMFAGLMSTMSGSAVKAERLVVLVSPCQARFPPQ